MLLEEPSDTDRAKPFRMARDVYKSCMDKEQIERLGLQPIKDILQTLGGWPVLEGLNWTGAHGGKPYSWYEQVYKLRRIGYSVDYFVDFSVKIDVKNSYSRTLDIDQPTLGMTRQFLINGTENERVKVRDNRIYSTIYNV